MIILETKPLTVNACWQGRRFKTPAYKDYEIELGYMLKRYKQYAVSGFVEITYKFYLKNWKKSDIGNPEKALTDILVKNKLIDDDRFIMKLTITKIPSEKNKIEIILKKHLTDN